MRAGFVWGGGVSGFRGDLVDAMKQTHLSYLASKLIFVLNCFLSKLFLYLR